MASTNTLHTSSTISFLAQNKDMKTETASEHNAFTNLIGNIEKKTGFERGHIFSATVAALSFYIMFGKGSDFLCNLIGSLYPTYKSLVVPMSVKAIENPHEDNGTKWLIYWIVYSTFTLTEYLANCLMTRITFYWFFKCLFLIYCMVPGSYNGSLFIYRNVIRPLYLKYHNDIDYGIQQVTDTGKVMANEIVSALITGQDEVVAEVANIVHDDVSGALRKQGSAL